MTVSKESQKNIWYSGISDLQPEHANPGSSESDLVSGKMKETVIYTIVLQAWYYYRYMMVLLAQKVTLSIY